MCTSCEYIPATLLLNKHQNTSRVYLTAMLKPKMRPLNVWKMPTCFNIYYLFSSAQSSYHPQAHSYETNMRANLFVFFIPNVFTLPNPAKVPVKINQVISLEWNEAHDPVFWIKMSLRVFQEIWCLFKGGKVTGRQVWSIYYEISFCVSTERRMSW